VRLIVQWSLHFVVFGFFKPITVDSFKSLGLSPVQWCTGGGLTPPRNSKILTKLSWIPSSVGIHV
jgi:hypothetical protein